MVAVEVVVALAVPMAGTAAGRRAAAVVSWYFGTNKCELLKGRGSKAKSSTRDHARDRRHFIRWEATTTAVAATEVVPLLVDAAPP